MILLGIPVSYALLWVILFYALKPSNIPLGQDVCFDDWCASVVRKEFTHELNHAKGNFAVLTVRISNKAKRVAMKPDNPGIVISDEKENSYFPSEKGQKLLDQERGEQYLLDRKLESGESLQTRIVFEVPEGSHIFKAQIQEGPEWLKYLLLPIGRNSFDLD